MDYVEPEPSHSYDAQTNITFHIDSSIRSVSQRLEDSIKDAERDGDSYRTVHPDTGTLARIQDYDCRGAQIELTHTQDRDSGGYVADICIQGSEERVEDLKQDIDDIMEDI